MKKFLLSLLILLLVLPCVVMAQNNARRRGPENDHPRPNFEQYLEEKCNAVVQEMGLTPQESERFLPVYREMQREKLQLYRKYGGVRPVRMAIARGEQVADTTLLRITSSVAHRQAEDAQIELRYYDRLTKVLTPMQLYKLQLAEQKFKTDMMKRSDPQGKTMAKPMKK